MRPGLVAFLFSAALASTSPAGAATVYVDDLADGEDGSGSVIAPYRDLRS